MRKVAAVVGIAIATLAFVAMGLTDLLGTGMNDLRWAGPPGGVLFRGWSFLAVGDGGPILLWFAHRSRKG